MKHTNISNIQLYAVQAERALKDIKGVALLYRNNPNELTRYDLQQLVGELHAKTCAMIHYASMISHEEIEAEKEAKK
jgi:hypothetical protein